MALQLFVFGIVSGFVSTRPQEWAKEEVVICRRARYPGSSFHVPAATEISHVSRPELGGQARPVCPTGRKELPVILPVPRKGVGRHDRVVNEILVSHMDCWAGAPARCSCSECGNC